MKKLLVLVVVLVLVGAASWAQSDMGTGQWLHDLWGCYQRDGSGTGNRKDQVNAFLYMGFVSGAVVVMQDAEWIGMSSSRTVGQSSAVVGKYLDEHPEQWNQPAEVLVYRALYAVWPGKVAAPYQ